MIMLRVWKMPSLADRGISIKGWSAKKKKKNCLYSYNCAYAHNYTSLRNYLPAYAHNYTGLRNYLPAPHEYRFVLLHRLRGWGQPFLALHPGLLRDTLAYHGCAELFQVSCLSLFLFCIGRLSLLLCIIAESQFFYSQV